LAVFMAMRRASSRVSSLAALATKAASVLEDDYHHSRVFLRQFPRELIA
jgi:hypothetical protein